MTGHVSHASRTAASCSLDGCSMTKDTPSAPCRNTCGAKSTHCPEPTQRSPSTLTLMAASTNIVQCLYRLSTLAWNFQSSPNASYQYGISSVVPFSRLNRTTVSTHVWTRSSTNLIVLSPKKTISVPSAVCPTCVYWISPCPSSSRAAIHWGCHTRSGCSASCRSSMPIRPARSTFRPCGYWALGRSVSVPSGCSVTFAYPRPLLYSSTNQRISSSTGLVLPGPRPLLGVSVIAGVSFFASCLRSAWSSSQGGPPGCSPGSLGIGGPVPRLSQLPEGLQMLVDVGLAHQLSLRPLDRIGRRT